MSTRYSRNYTGDMGNHHLPMSVDVTEGYVGISQPGNDGRFDRVLLTPYQWRVIKEFVARKRRN